MYSYTMIGNSFLCSLWLEDIRTEEKFDAAATIYAGISKNLDKENIYKLG